MIPTTAFLIPHLVEKGVNQQQCDLERVIPLHECFIHFRVAMSAEGTGKEERTKATPITGEKTDVISTDL